MLRQRRTLSNPEQHSRAHTHTHSLLAAWTVVEQAAKGAFVSDPSNMDATKLNPNMFSPWRAFPPPQPQTQYDAMITRAEDGKVRSLTPRGLADILWGCAVTSRGTSKLFEELCEQAQRKIDTFSPRDIANFAWGLVKVKFQCWPLQRRFVRLCMSRLGEFDGESLVLTFWSLAQVAELQELLDKPVRASCYTLCQHIPSLSAPSCMRLWELLAKLDQYNYDLCKALDVQTGDWAHLMTPGELGEVMTASSDMRMRLVSFPVLLRLSFEHLERVDEMNPVLVAPFMLHVLGAMYCYASWIHVHDREERRDKSNEATVGLNEQTDSFDDKHKLKDAQASSGAGGSPDSAAAARRRNTQESSSKANKVDGSAPDEDEEIRTRIPAQGPLLTQITLDVLASAMPRVIERVSIAQAIDILLALTSVSAYREGHDCGSPGLLSTMYRALWAKLGDGRALNSGQVVHLGAGYDLMSFDGCAEACRPTQALLTCIQERRSGAAAEAGRGGDSRGGTAGSGASRGGGSGDREKQRRDLQRKSETRQDVYDLLTSLQQECKMTMPGVDVAIPDSRVAIKVVGAESYAKNDPYTVGIERLTLGWTSLHTRQLAAMRWTPVLIDAEAYMRIATSAKRKNFLCRLLKMGKFAPGYGEESNVSNDKKKKKKKKKKRK